MEKDRKSLELAEIHRLNQLNAEMLVLLKDVVELLGDENDDWMKRVKAVIEKAENKESEGTVTPEILHVLNLALEDKAKQYEKTFDSRMDNDPVVIALRNAINKIEKRGQTGPGKIVIHVQGGLIQAIYSDVLGINIKVFDLDNDDRDEQASDLEQAVKDMPEYIY